MDRVTIYDKGQSSEYEIKKARAKQSANDKTTTYYLDDKKSNDDNINEDDIITYYPSGFNRTTKEYYVANTVIKGGGRKMYDLKFVKKSIKMAAKKLRSKII
jgi:hypothetical protein